jgi:hypothetical protein
MVHGTELINDDEIVYRRIPANPEFYDPAQECPVAWVNFKPNKNDLGGISIWRAKFKSPKQVVDDARKPGRQYYVAHLRIAELRAPPCCITIEPSEQEGGIGHASLVTLNYHAYRSDKNRITELAEFIARNLCTSIIGPIECAPE